MSMWTLIAAPPRKILAERLGAAYRYECRTNEVYQVGGLLPLSEPDLAAALKNVLVAEGGRLTIRHFPRSAIVVSWHGWCGSMARDFSVSGNTEMEALLDLLRVIANGEAQP